MSRGVLLGIVAVLVVAGIWAWPAGRPLRTRSAVLHAAKGEHAGTPSSALDSAQTAEAEAGDAPPPSPPAAADDMRRNRTTETLLERLASSDQFLVIDAADGLRARKAVVAIPRLAAIDVSANPDSARTVIDALGQLAGQAAGADRSVAVERLLVLLAQEKSRASADAPGNVLQIYQALGQTQDVRAAQALERELADPGIPLAALTVVTDSLVALGQSSSKGPLAAARGPIAARAVEGPLERAIQAEVLAAIERALGTL